MNKEASIHNPDELLGMTQIQQESIDLSRARLEAYKNVEQVQYAASLAIDRVLFPHPADPSFSSKVAAGSLAVYPLQVWKGAEIVTAQFGARRSDRRSRKHYEKHREAYQEQAHQEQAAKDARKAGVEHKA